jgi:hypothetical protein
MKQYQKRVCRVELMKGLMKQLTAVLDREQEIAKQALKEGNKVCLSLPTKLIGRNGH